MRWKELAVKDAEKADARVRPCRTYTVHELAELSGVTVRALHHYDKMGLVCPQRSDNGYRVYGAVEIDRLQQVLLYRECGMALADVKRMLDDPLFDECAALKAHLQELFRRREHLNDLIASVQRTLACREEGWAMEDEERFKAFKRKVVKENERAYGIEVRKRWGDAVADASNEKVMGMDACAWKDSQSLEERVRRNLIAAMKEGNPAGEAARHVVDLHRQWLCAFWPDGSYSKEAHLGLAESYVTDERFRAYYDAIAPGAAEFLRDAVAAYCS